MLKRALSPFILSAAHQLPVVSITGPRQSGKTTLVRHLFPQKPYINFENLDERALAREDPRGFLAQFKEGAILDEIQHLPELFSYIQVLVDEEQRPGHFILTGSQNFLLMQGISQSLSGRVALFHLLPLSLAETQEQLSLDDQLYKGFYPRLYNTTIAVDPKLFYRNYISTYIERDVRQITKVQDLSRFQTFMQICAHRVGQLVNYTSIAGDCGVSVNTVKDWLSLLETSYVIYLLRPYHKNFGKRLIKMPKLYFYDVGLACHLANIPRENLAFSSLKGPLFENMVVLDLYKAYLPEVPPLFFWRDQSGHEVDCLIDTPQGLQAIETKSSQTAQGDFTRGLKRFQHIAPNIKGTLIYGGDAQRTVQDITYMPWISLRSAPFHS